MTNHERSVHAGSAFPIVTCREETCEEIGGDYSGVTLEGIGGEGYADYRRQVSRTPAC